MNPQHDQTGNTTTHAPTISDAIIVEGTQTTQPTPTKNKRVFFAFVLGLIIGAVTGAYYFGLIFKDDSVAVVNGIKIPRNEFESSVVILKQNAVQQGVDMSAPGADEKIKTEALDTLINNALLIGGAKTAGIIADETKVEEQYDVLVQNLGGEETLKKRMAEIGLTEEKLEDNIRDRIIADTFIEQGTDIEGLTVTEDEVTTFIKSISTEGAELPPLDQITPQIKAQLLQEKQQGVLLDFLEKLRNEARIKIKI